MKSRYSRCLATAVIVASLITTPLSAQAGLPAVATCIPAAPGLLASTDVDDLDCLPQARRVELLTLPVETPVLPPLARVNRLQIALHQLKAEESEALAVADPSAGRALDAYLEGREIESKRSAATRRPRRELARSRSRMMRMSADLVIAATAATDWVHRQPGRDLPPDYRQRVVFAAAAILAEDVRRRDLASACDELDREFDRKLRHVLKPLG